MDRILDLLMQDNPLRRRLGLRYPILQAGMGQVAYGALAGAVSAAGGLGVIGAGYLSGAELREEIATVRQLTDRPFGVDILFAEVAGDGEAERKYTRQVQEQIDAALDERVPVLISGLGNPLQVVAECHARGILVMSVVGNARRAHRIADSGVDMVIASGAEGGGHVGRVGSFSLLPAVLDAVAVPVIAGGGVGDGRGLAAALAMGAAGVWMGTRFIASDEARAHANYKDRLVAGDEEATVISRAHSGKPVRMLRNAFTEHWKVHEAEIQPYPRQLDAVGRDATIRGRIEGDVENGVLPAGQGLAMVREVMPAGRIVEQVYAEGADALERLVRARASGAEAPG